VLAHAAALQAFLAPTVNAYKRFVPGALVPRTASWGFDNRTSFVRVPPEGGSAARVEVRGGDGSANPYLAIAATLLAGLQGLEAGLEPPPPLEGNALEDDPAGTPLPRSLEESLDALRADDWMTEGMGAGLVHAFCTQKAREAERFRLAVTDWELDEYAWHL
jgi:glutamine synthetase